MSTEELLRLLNSNNHFPDPERWIDFARENSFHSVPSSRRERCPSCDCADHSVFGQYVYYSSLIRLRRCRGCDLIFSDVLLAPEVIARHFESAYKDEDYFLRRRQNIFAEIAVLAASLLPAGGSLLDVGGATGHLANEVRRRRADAQIVVNDISNVSCEAAAKLGFETICGDMTVLGAVDRQFNLVLAIDVVYYEPQITTTWAALAARTAPGGYLVLRIPNRLQWIRFAEAARRFKRKLDKTPQTRVASFNTEHIYIFSRRYLTQTLQQYGFNEVRPTPSHFLASMGPKNIVRSWTYKAVRALAALTRGRILLSSSQLIVARRSAGSEPSGATERNPLR